jgi:hypothetical protein
MYECSFCAMWKKLELSSDNGHSGRINAKEAMVTPMVGSGDVCVWREFGIRWPVFCSYIWQESGFSHLEVVVRLNLGHLSLLYKEIVHTVYFQCDLHR